VSSPILGWMRERSLLVTIDLSRNMDLNSAKFLLKLEIVGDIEVQSFRFSYFLNYRNVKGENKPNEGWRGEIIEQIRTEKHLACRV